MGFIDRITTDPAVCGGRPCLRGLRIRVKDVLDLLAAGASADEILADYPYLEADDISAALAFAAGIMIIPSAERMIALPGGCAAPASVGATS